MSANAKRMHIQCDHHRRHRRPGRSALWLTPGSSRGPASRSRRTSAVSGSFRIRPVGRRGAAGVPCWAAWVASSRSDNFTAAPDQASGIIFIIGAICAFAGNPGSGRFPHRDRRRVGVASGRGPGLHRRDRPPDIRGRLITFFQLTVTVGILVAYLVGLAFRRFTE